jgi:hypothetical protein
MPRSRPSLRLVVLSLVLVGAVFVAVSAALEAVAHWAESRFESYPYLAGEDPMRVLLPSVHAAFDGGTLLLGPSAMGEAFLTEELEHRWGSRVRSAGLSNGTLDDFYLFLSYIERAYGTEALPQRLVLGIDAKAFACLPRLFGSRRTAGAVPYLIGTLDRYSTHFRVAPGELGTELVPKAPGAALVAWLRFNLFKQQPRYRTGMLAAIEHALDADPLKVGFQRAMPPFPDDFRRPFDRLNLPVSVAFARHAGAGVAARDWLRAYRSPYTFQILRPMDESVIRRLLDGWGEYYAWDPREEEALVSMQLHRLAAFVERHHIELVVVYLPVHHLADAMRDSARIVATAAALEADLPTAKFVDLSSAVPPELFYDNIHVAYEGARRTTERLAAALLPVTPREPHQGHDD